MSRPEPVRSVRPIRPAPRSCRIRPCRRSRARRAASTSSAIRTSRSPPRSTGSSPTRSTPGGSCRARGWPRSASSGAALRVNPNTIRAVYKRLADAGYVTSRHGAGHPRRRPAARAARRGGPGRARRGDAPPRRVGRLHAPTRWPRPRSPRRPSASGPGPHVHVLFAECTNADAAYDAQRIAGAFPEVVVAEGALLDELTERLDRFHYDLVATTTFHADEAQALVGGRVPVVAMLVGPGYMDLIHEIAALPAGSTVGLVCASARGAANIAETLAFSGTTGVSVIWPRSRPTSRPRWAISTHGPT